MHGAERANKMRTEILEIWGGDCNWQRKVLMLQIFMQSYNIYKIGTFSECSPESGYISLDVYFA